MAGFLEIPGARGGGLSTIWRSGQGCDVQYASGSGPYYDTHASVPLGIASLRFERRAGRIGNISFYGVGGPLGAKYYPASDPDGGSIISGAFTAPPVAPVAVWTPKFTIDQIHDRFQISWGTGYAFPVDYTVSDIITPLPAPAGERTFGWYRAPGSTTTSYPGYDLTLLNGPWVSSEAAGTSLNVRTTVVGARVMSVPLHVRGGTLTATLTSQTGTATLLDLGGTTDLGGGVLSIPPDTRCAPRWSVEDGATLRLTKGAGSTTTSYGPLYIETPIVPPTAPTITKLIPTSGPDTGGTLVDIIGTDLGGATAVDFGGTAGIGLTVDPSGGLATVTSPAHTAGPAPVTITTPAGTSAAETFTFEAPPVVTVPVIYGTYPLYLCADAPDRQQVLIPIIYPITDVVSAEVDGVHVGVGGVLDVNEVGFVVMGAPVLPPGTYDLVLTNSAGSSDPYPIEYLDCEGCPPDPTVIAVFPGAARPGATIQIVGTNLTGATVTMCGDPVAIVSNDGNIITVAVPPGCPDGPATITITTPDGETTAGLTVLPASGPTGGPDVIANLVALLAAELGVPVSSRRSPTATKDSDPSVVVRRTGGPSKGVASDNPTVTIEAWAPTTTESFQLLQSARLVVIEAAEQGRAGLRRYDEFAGPADLPDPSTTNPRHTLTASVVTRIE